MPVPQKVIDQHCQDCIYDTANCGTWRQQVEACTVESCALWPYRAKTVQTKAKEKQERFKAMSPSERQRYLENSRAAKEKFAKYRKPDA